MKIIAVNVGLPKLVEINNTHVATGIYKKPVETPVKIVPRLASD